MPTINELTDLTATHVSYVRKGANKKQFFLMKSDDETLPVFEKEFDIIINKADEKKLVYGVVYEPNAVDTQNEFAKADTIETAAHKFLADCRNVDLQHNFKKGYGDVVESYVAPADFKIGEQEVKKGSWVLVTKATDEVWEDIKKGVITGYSMAGKATRTPVKDNNLKKEAFDGSDTEVKSFFDVMKNFFTGGKVEKADEVGKVKTFSQRMAVNDVMDGMWKVTDTLRCSMQDILSSPDIKDKKAALESAIDEFAAYMKKRISSLGNGDVKKEDAEFFSVNPVIKAGKTISGDNMQIIKEAHEALTALMKLEKNENDDGGDVEVKKEELQEVVKAVVSEALKPVNEKLATFEKQDSGGNTGVTQTDLSKEDIAVVIKTVVEESLKPVNEKINAIEKARGFSRQEAENPNMETVKKSVFSGLNI